MTYFLEIHPDGERHEYWKNADGLYHRKDGPAFTRYYYENGNISVESWCINGKQHREGSPSFIRYHENGNIAEEVWMVNRFSHREDGPAYIEYDMEGNVSHKEYYCNGYYIDDIVEKIFGCVPNKLTKEQQILLKLSIPVECFA